MRRFHSNAGSFGQPRCDSESPRILLGTVLFAFLEALKLSPSTLLSLHFGEGQMHVPRFASLMVGLSNSRKCSEHPLQTLANLRKMRLIFPAGLGETKTCRCQRLVVAAHTVYSMACRAGVEMGGARTAPLYCLPLASEPCFGHHRDNGSAGPTFVLIGLLK